MSRSRVREREPLRSAIQTSDPVALAAYAELLQPVALNFRSLVKDATSAPDKRVLSRVDLRREILKKLREIETRVEVASNATSAT